MKTKHFAKHNRMACAIILCAAAVTGVHAQGYMSDAASSSAVNTRDPARQASTEIDAVVNNPAGTAFLEDGLHLSASGMLTFRNLEAYPKANPSQILKTNETRMLPALQVAFKKNRWTVSASFASEGGFGKMDMKDGSLVADKIINTLTDKVGAFSEVNEILQYNITMLNLFGNAVGMTDTGMSEEDKLSYISNNVNMTLYNWTTRIGAAFEINKHLSAYIGLKANYVSSKSDLGIKQFMYRPSTGERWSFSDYSNKIMSVINNLPNIDDEFYNSTNEILSEISDIVDNSDLSQSQITDIHGWGFAPIIGIDYKTEKLNFGAKYEFASHINAKGTSDFNIPAYLSVGMNWQTTRKLKLAAGGNVIFPVDKNISGNNKIKAAFDLSASATWEFNDKWLVSGGYTYGEEQLAVPEYVPLIINGFNHHKISLGTAFSPIKNLQINLGINTSFHQNINSVEINQNFENLYVNGEEYSISFKTESGYKFKPKVQIALGVNYKI